MSFPLLQEYLNGPASGNGGKIAVTDGRRSISYHDLSVLSNQIAHCLKFMGVCRQDRVVMCLNRSAGCIAAILGILKADAVYVPLDHKAPSERWACIIGDAAPKALICDDKTIQTAQAAIAIGGVNIPILVLCKLNDIQDGPVENIIGLEGVNSFDGAEPSYLNCGDDLAYILYTSGSTGRPKGVMISHANVRAYIDWAVTCFGISEMDKILGTAPFHFDMSTFDIYASLKAGATFCVADEIQTLFPEKLVNFIEQQQATLWKGVSSLLMYMARAGVLQKGRMPTLKQVIFAGEALPTKYLIEWMSTFPEKNFYNGYGPTEATGVSTYYHVPKVPEGPHVRIPIGVPRRGTRVFLLSEDGSEVQNGETGELCVGGPGLARGYLNDPGKTAKSFVVTGDGSERIYRTGDLARLMPDGNLDYLGRKDRQLKLMGYRIEAEEIEQVLLATGQIKDAAVDLVASKISEGMFELTAFCEAEEDIDFSKMIAELKKRLPHYMIPKRCIRIEKMPRCERGKIKRDSLKHYCQDQ